MLQNFPAALLFLSLFFSCSNSKQTVSTKDDYFLVWSDEFNENGPPDSSRWRFETGFVRNQEVQWYQAENAVCKDEYLVIKGKRERKSNPWFTPGSTDWKKNREFIEYTAASVVMKKQHAFQYAKVEVRAKIDAQAGLWPAIIDYWLMQIK